MHSNNPIDRLLDEALKSYEGEPPEGLADRILHSLDQTAILPKKHRFWWWAIPMTVATVALLLLFVLPQTEWRKPPVVSPKIAVTLPPVKSLSPVQTLRVSAAVPENRRIRASSRKQTEQFPKQSIFPTPSPLSREKEVLLQAVDQLPKEELLRIVEFQKSASEPISIARLKIEPIEISNQSSIR